jgi:anhydro-N-acetylmuramic acid kinase
MARVSASEIAAVAAHGQTLYHDPPSTIQWFDPALLAAETGCAVVSDFRRADCAAGGQGAPLVPYADYVLFRDPTKTRLLLNIGGIANVTFLRAGAGIDDVVAFDSGPGNCVSDWLCRTLDPAGPGYDAGGGRAMRGEVRREIVDRIDTTYFRRPPPKSTDVPEMITRFRDAIGDPRRHALDDLLATACWFSVEEALNQTFTYVDASLDQVIVAGGGTRNARIMKELNRWAETSADLEVLTSDALGVPSEARESVAFALLAAATLDGLPSNVPAATGARRRAILGSITPKP